VSDELELEEASDDAEDAAAEDSSAPLPATAGGSTVVGSLDGSSTIGGRAGVRAFVRNASATPRPARPTKMKIPKRTERADIRVIVPAEEREEIEEIEAIEDKRFFSL